MIFSKKRREKHHFCHWQQQLFYIETISTTWNSFWNYFFCKVEMLALKIPNKCLCHFKLMIRWRFYLSTVVDIQIQTITETEIKRQIYKWKDDWKLCIFTMKERRIEEYKEIKKPLIDRKIKVEKEQKEWTFGWTRNKISKTVVSWQLCYLFFVLFRNLIQQVFLAKVTFCTKINLTLKLTF